MYTLITLLISLGLMLIDKFILKSSVGILQNLYALAVFVPGLAVSVRRLHDVNRNGKDLLWLFLPIVGWIMVIIWTVKEGDAEENQYGHNPKLSAGSI